MRHKEIPVPRPRPRNGRHIEYKESPIWNSRAANDVLHERRRQVEAEGWTPEHDDAHGRGEIARAACSYAYEAGRTGQQRSDSIGSAPPMWPWDLDWWKPSNARRDLVKAGALILAEIERLDRVARNTERAAAALARPMDVPAELEWIADWLQERIVRAERDRDAYLEGSANAAFYDAQIIAYDNALGAVLHGTADAILAARLGAEGDAGERARCAYIAEMHDGSEYHPEARHCARSIAACIRDDAFQLRDEANNPIASAPSARLGVESVAELTTAELKAAEEAVLAEWKAMSDQLMCPHISWPVAPTNWRILRAGWKAIADLRFPTTTPASGAESGRTGS